MTAEHMIGIYMVIEETMQTVGHTSHHVAGVSDAEVLTVAVVAAAFCANLSWLPSPSNGSHATPVPQAIHS